MEELKENRFEFSLYVNENLICARNFRINMFYEDSMRSIEFLHTARGIVDLIKKDLVSKSRIYSWFYDGPVCDDLELMKNVKGGEYVPKKRHYEPESVFNVKIEPWEVTFKFVILDKKKSTPVFEEIWDGSVYPKTVREKVDLSNRKDRFTEGDSFLSFDNYLWKAMVNEKPNLINEITKRICNACSPVNAMSYDQERRQRFKPQAPNDEYSFCDFYRTKVNTMEKNIETGELEKVVKVIDEKKYIYGETLNGHKLSSDLGSWPNVANKTKKYISEQYVTDKF